MDPTEKRDQEIVAGEVKAAQDRLYDLTDRVINDTTMRREATEALEGIIQSHEPPEQPWVRRL